MNTLVLGCGLKKPAGSIGIDMNPGTTADLLYDLNRPPYPLKADSFERILCHDILEHLDDIVAVMREIHRIGAPGALVDIKTPHFSSILSWNDPTHRHHFSRTSFEYFTHAPDRWRTQFYTREKFAALTQEITFTRAPRRGSATASMRCLHASTNTTSPGSSRRKASISCYKS